ncbi:bifunctional diguanylate cyclase/phosphodiesterase [Actinoplanes bogorensis]|uniref:Bifunctional diguanylate cyclase/phosphodiesterase n=1 Tax=Paractinoplanes bogorensis TaxID=1610840 RepID=A0ABS5Z152_9ACTN|nr:bifunctional diguanylate cyclase/phosphodiesterase [Actinoplanes bogorensis]MBU2669051.1 bifunctional diguanylate cyclase/phosphodiesterase [Actinoplanes bogorensis]
MVGRAWWWPLLAVPLLVAGWFLPLQGQLLTYAVAAGSSTVAVAIGIRRNRPARPVAWWLLTSAMACSTIGTLIWAAAPGSYPPHGDEVSIVDVFYGLAYPQIAIGLTLLPDRRTGISRWARLTDTGIVLITALVLAWVLLYDPYVHDAAIRVATPSMELLPFIDALLAGMALRLLVVQARFTRVHAVVLFATFVIALSDVQYFLAVMHGRWIAGPVLSMAGWCVAFVLIALAVLHPAAGAPAPATAARVHAWRTVPLNVALVVVGPATTLYTILRRWDEAGLDPDDVIVPLLLTGIVSVLLVLRMALATHVAEERAAEQEAMQESIRRMAVHDTLTGLPNRLQLEQQLAGAPPDQALLLLDLDGFKDVNDRLGHTIGDELLVAVAERLLPVAGAGETLVRLGGDEFVLLAPESRAGEVLAALRRPIEVSGHVLHMTGTVGIRRRDDGAGADQLLSDADLALYAAKAEGRDRFEVFDARLRREQAERIRTVERLREGLEAGEFTVHYQPIVALRGGAPVAFEALVRWTPPGQDPIGPDRFIPAAEDSGLIVGLGEWVLRQACADAAPWYPTYGTTISVNVSPRQLAEPDFADVVRRALTGSGLPPEALVLEITEGVLVRSGAHAELTLAHLTRLRADGVRVAIDDFGTGYSSLAYLRDLPIDILKIDRSFMPDDSSDAQQTALVRAVVDLARSLRLVTVAEGVETAQHADLLRTLGCDRGQGWLFGRPGPAPGAADLLYDWRDGSVPVGRKSP